MARKKISRAELKRRLMIVLEAWPGGLTRSPCRGEAEVNQNPGCIMQIALETQDLDEDQYVKRVSGVKIEELDDIVEANDTGQRARVRRLVGAL